MQDWTCHGTLIFISLFCGGVLPIARDGGAYWVTGTLADLTLSTLTGSSDTCCLRGPPWSIMSSSGTQNFQSSGCPSGSPSERRPAAKALEFTICAAARHLLGQCKECRLERLLPHALGKGKRAAHNGAYRLTLPRLAAFQSHAALRLLYVLQGMPGNARGIRGAQSMPI